MFQAIQPLSDDRDIGLAFWVWRERNSGNWGIFDYDTVTNTWVEREETGMDALIRPGAMAAPGGAFIELDGKPVEARLDLDTQRVLLPWDGRHGSHEILVSPLPPR